ncbi:MAG: septum formation initiator family protein [Candidatus Krumholzibacteria bacterium]|jgi:cell division protein FtsB|nr:septum formation initiator family protein [Candidatus Krumholzibacteria bacterium]MDP6668576.1 septum formation initiator family protein [Candidatus Krumholzibacteria bacterium]MDP6796837.1 septum formation initiator family protein [Candidatus Krumholzibacteria bacterium]MDP7021355.1 septum formation initiator family protein [Candidatus Krumholzibacteria bacterium]
MPPSPQPFLRRPWQNGRIAGVPWRPLLLLGGGLLLLIFFFGQKGQIHQSRLKQQQSRLKGEIRVLENQETQLQNEIQLLQEDPGYREKVAREEWGYKKNDETVYYLKRESQP